MLRSAPSLTSYSHFGRHPRRRSHLGGPATSPGFIPRRFRVNTARTRPSTGHGNSLTEEGDATPSAMPLKRASWRVSKTGALSGLEKVDDDIEAPGPGEARVKVRAIGLNFADVFSVLGVDFFRTKTLATLCHFCVTLDTASILPPVCPHPLTFASTRASALNETAMPRVPRPAPARRSVPSHPARPIRARAGVLRRGGSGGTPRRAPPRGHCGAAPPSGRPCHGGDSIRRLRHRRQRPRRGGARAPPPTSVRWTTSPRGG